MITGADLGSNITATVNRLASELQNTVFYADFILEVQTAMSTQPFPKETFASDCFDLAKNSSLDTRLRNALFHLMQTHPTLLVNPDTPRQILKEPLAYLRKAQNSWERRLVKCMNSMTSEIGVPLARRRPRQEVEELKDRWRELSMDETDLSEIRPVYAAKDFLEVLSSLRNPNYDENVEETVWGVIKLPLKTRDVKGLVEFYGEIAACVKHIGLDDTVPGEYKPTMTLATERLMLGRKVLERNHGPMSKELCKQGCPPSLRAGIWHQVLGLEIGQQQKDHFESLKNLVFEHDLLVDRLIKKDIQLTCSNDDHYFVYEDVLHQVLLCFFRDTEILRHFENSSGSPSLAVSRGTALQSDTLVAFPPCGIIPFHGFTMYASPLCCLYEDPVDLYFTFREMYQRFWYRLHCVSSHPQGAVALCLQFEQLLQFNEKELWQHCSSLGIQILPVAFRWMLRAFSGYLSPEQLLHLWDIILAWSSLEILPTLSLAIISFRREHLMDVTSQQAAEAVLADLSTIKVIPLIKLALSGDKSRDIEP